jgi:predicted solute-binding protein
LYGAETWTFPKVDQKYQVLKCGAEEGCRRSVGPIVREMKKYYIESRRRGISYKQ